MIAFHSAVLLLLDVIATNNLMGTEQTNIEKQLGRDALGVVLGFKAI